MVREDFGTLPGLSPVWYTGKETTNMFATLSEQPGQTGKGIVSEDQLIFSQKPEDIRGTASRPGAVREGVSAPPLAAVLLSVFVYECMAPIAFPCVSLSPKIDQNITDTVLRHIPVT